MCRWSRGKRRGRAFGRRLKRSGSGTGRHSWTKCGTEAGSTAASIAFRGRNRSWPRSRPCSPTPSHFSPRPGCSGGTERRRSRPRARRAAACRTTRCSPPSIAWRRRPRSFARPSPPGFGGCAAKSLPRPRNRSAVGSSRTGASATTTSSWSSTARFEAKAASAWLGASGASTPWPSSTSSRTPIRSRPKCSCGSMARPGGWPAVRRGQARRGKPGSRVRRVRMEPRWSRRPASGGRRGRHRRAHVERLPARGRMMVRPGWAGSSSSAIPSSPSTGSGGRTSSPTSGHATRRTPPTS